MKVKIFTPHNVERLHALEGLRLANFKQRAFAFIFDLAMCFFLFLFTMFIVGLFIWFRATEGTFSTYSFSFDRSSWYGNLIMNIIIPILYFGFLTFLTNGKTIGKKLMKIRVVSLVNKKISLWNSVERCLGYATSIFILGIGFFQFFFYPNRKTAHDCLAETIVIREDEKINA